MADSRTSTGRRSDADVLVSPGALARMTAPVRSRMILGAAMSAASSVCALVPFVAVAEVVRLLLDSDPGTTVWIWVVVGVVAMVARSLLYGGALSLCHFADVDFVHLLRRRVVRHLRLLPLGWFDESGSGEVKKAVTDDVTRIHVIVAHLAGDLTSAVLVPLVSIGYLLTRNVPMTLLLLAYIVVVFAMAAPSMQRGYQAYMDEWNRAQGAVSTATVELVDGVEVVKTYGTSSAVFRRFDDAVSRLTHVAYLWTAAMGRPAAVINILFFPATMIAVVLGLGLLAVGLGWIDAVGVIPFLLVGVSLPSGYLQVAQLANGMRTAALGATHIDRLLSLPGLPDPDDPAVPADSAVRFDHVDFAYTDGVPVLTNISFELAPGTVTALVGPSGSGKTTIARLIPRFWDVSGGMITIGGVDVRQIPTPELLSRIAIVFQDAVVLTDTVRENVRLGRPGASDADVEQACRDAQIHQRIADLPNGYDTVLGSAEGHLSGGELQRVTIARAFLQDAPIILLDEATAHADPHSEVQIQQALNRLGAGRSVLVIAHRLSTIVHADQILVLDDGQIIERGHHDDLIAADGRYARMWAAQDSAAARAGAAR
ncbi:ABC transporter ATP-binding protein [Brooklawnia cerclae]|uniref:ATP-binding cassette subfamily B protein n=1 Tax=Brooklawnia cerclae TaxID=349934 RepID=A0ABX0SE14_9ACTN|nr:ABC transporter ATP-binding protein [Brooklawnia cerclae]NIH56643.1 ATP-binding cassette subfamily B protein [Brooklawnia cerclae]